MSLSANLSRIFVPGPGTIETDFPIASGVHIYQGSAVEIADGYARPASNSLSGITLLMGGGWVAQTEADYTAGDRSVRIATKRFDVFTNDSVTPLTAADRGNLVRMKDDDTVTAGGNGPIQGVFAAFYNDAHTLCLVYSDAFSYATPATAVSAVQELGAADAMTINPLDKLLLVQGDSATVTYATALPAGTPGQIVTFMGGGDADTKVLTIPTGCNLLLAGGVSMEFKLGASLTAVYNGSDWVEICRALALA